MNFYQKRKSVNPLSYKPGGIQLTFLFKDGTYLTTHKLVKYPKQYALAVVAEKCCTNNPVIKVYHQNGIIYEKNNS